MSDIQGKKIFRLHLSISVVLILLTLGTLSLFASFYLGMITGKSMQRPPGKSVIENEFNMEKQMSDEDLKFFGLGDFQKEQENLNLEDINELKNKTDELAKISEINKTKPPKIPKISEPKVVSIINPEKEGKKEENKNLITSSLGRSKTPVSEKESSKKIESNLFYTIQVFATRNHKSAKKLVKKLKKDGFGDSFIFKHSAGDKTLYRVRVGKASRKDANLLSNRLKKLKYIDSVQISRF